MATTKVTPVQLLRSIVNNKRPDPSKLLSGQVAVNLADTQPGMFFANASGGLVKIGPCTVGINPPNNATGWPNAPAPTSTGNTLGELWLDTNGDPPLFPGPVLKVWNGTTWINCFPAPSVYSSALVSATAPTIINYPDGTMWWDSSTGLMYVLYNDGVSRQWTQVSGNTVP